MDGMIDRINMRTMRSNSAISSYTRAMGLTPAEQAALDRVRDDARGKSILDIGFGGGRTVLPLLDISPDYHGIDNSPEMVTACQRVYPGVRLECADARNLSHIADDSVFLAVFSCNGLGMVGHEDRLTILGEVYRVLQPGGAFVFSTHNQRCPDHVAGFRFPEFEPARNPLRFLVRSARFAWHTLARVHNRRRFRRHEVRTPEYSIINDVCHHYGTMLYYISLAHQHTQLEQIGFMQGTEAFDLCGRPIEHDSLDSSITLVARKPATAG